MRVILKIKSNSFANWKVWGGLLFFSNCVAAQSNDVHVKVLFDTNAYKHGKYYIVKCLNNDTVYQSSVCGEDSLLLDNRFEYKFIYPINVKKGKSLFGYFFLPFTEHRYLSEKVVVHIDKYKRKRNVKTNVYIEGGGKWLAGFTKLTSE